MKLLQRSRMWDRISSFSPHFLNCCPRTGMQRRLLCWKCSKDVGAYRIPLAHNSFHLGLIPSHSGQIIVAGSGSTGDAIAATLWAISRDAKARERVLQEVQEATAGGGKLEARNLSKLTFTACCVKEVMRSSAFASLTFRVATQDTEL